MKKKLLLIVPSLALGGQERVACNTAEILKNDYEVCLVIFDDSNAAYHISDDITLKNLNIPSKSGLLPKIFNQIKRAHALRRLRTSWNADYSYSFGNTANLSNVLSRSKVGGATIVSIHDYAAACNTGLVSRFVFKMSDCIIGVSQGLCDEIRKRNSKYYNKVICIYNPIDLHKNVVLSRENPDDYTFTSKTIVACGRLVHVKNFSRLIKAFSIVKKDLCNVKLLILGDGNRKTYLQDLIKKLNLEESVALLGFRKNPYAYIARSDLYVLSSFYEGLPNSLIEALPFAPVVSVDCKTGPREILDVNPSAGILVNQADKQEETFEIDENDQSLADAMLQMLKNSELAEKYHSAGIKRANDFTYDAIKRDIIFALNALDNK